MMTTMRRLQIMRLNPPTYSNEKEVRLFCLRIYIWFNQVSIFSQNLATEMSHRTDSEYYLPNESCNVSLFNGWGVKEEQKLALSSRWWCPTPLCLDNWVADRGTMVVLGKHWNSPLLSQIQLLAQVATEPRAFMVFSGRRRTFNPPLTSYIVVLVCNFLKIVMQFWNFFAMNLCCTSIQNQRGRLFVYCGFRHYGFSMCVTKLLTPSLAVNPLMDTPWSPLLVTLFSKGPFK